LGKNKFLLGIDANYALAMKQLGLSWYDENGRKVEPYEFFAGKGINSARIRLWVGEEGPSKLKYALETAKRAKEVKMDILLVLFLSDRWADLYKQPMPEIWTNLDFNQKKEAIESYTKRVTERFEKENIEVGMYSIGNEINYGLCGIFAYNKKGRKKIGWLKNKIWSKVATLIKAGISGVKSIDSNVKIMLHIAMTKPEFDKAFFKTMSDLNVEFDYVGLSYYPTISGDPDNTSLSATIEAISEVFNGSIYIVEYAYPSSVPRGQIWFMNKQVSGYPFTPEGQKNWIEDFLHYCREHPKINGAFYWSPEMYLDPSFVKRLPKEKVKEVTQNIMPLNFGWAPMSLFNSNGFAKISVNSFLTIS
jgi:arabinogalactan endo-1,4-beta-galactosidase